MRFIYDLVKLLCKTINTIYFKSIYLIGEDNIPNDGPLIICGNHSNQFIDPMLIMTYCQRELNFTMAASSYKKK